MALNNIDSTIKICTTRYFECLIVGNVTKKDAREVAPKALRSISSCRGSETHGQKLGGNVVCACPEICARRACSPLSPPALGGIQDACQRRGTSDCCQQKDYEIIQILIKDFQTSQIVWPSTILIVP